MKDNCVRFGGAGMKIIKVVVDELPKSVNECKAVKSASALPDVNSHLHRVFCKLDLNQTKTQIMTCDQFFTQRCPNCPLVEEKRGSKRRLK